LRVVAQDVVSLLVDVAKAAALETDERIEIDGVEIEFEVRIVIERLDRNGRRDGAGQRHSLDVVDGGETAGVDVPRKLEKGELLIGADQEGSRDAAVGHNHIPGVAAEEVDHAGDER